MLQSMLSKNEHAVHELYIQNRTLRCSLCQFRPWKALPGCLEKFVSRPHGPVPVPMANSELSVLALRRELKRCLLSRRATSWGGTHAQCTHACQQLHMNMYPWWTAALS
jgi:hypothetical protein